MMLADLALACQQDTRLITEKNEARITHESRGVRITWTAFCLFSSYAAFRRKSCAKGAIGLDLDPRKKLSRFHADEKRAFCIGGGRGA